jgi:hypothetical protein
MKPNKRKNQAGVPKHQLSDPRFQNLLAKADAHQRQFRPKETAELEKSGNLESVLVQRTELCWAMLKQARETGANLLEAEELAYPTILLPAEDEDD